jgi:N-acyl-D-amino-acid deacylase
MISSVLEKELENMKDLLDEQMKFGAFGLSTGLDYPPGSFSKTDEIIELCEVNS